MGWDALVVFVLVAVAVYGVKLGIRMYTQKRQAGRKPGFWTRNVLDPDPVRPHRRRRPADR